MQVGGRRQGGEAGAVGMGDGVGGGVNYIEGHWFIIV